MEDVPTLMPLEVPPDDAGLVVGQAVPESTGDEHTPAKLWNSLIHLGNPEDRHVHDFTVPHGPNYDAAQRGGRLGAFQQPVVHASRLDQPNQPVLCGPCSV